jgi:pyruvate kinase
VAPATDSTVGRDEAPHEDHRDDRPASESEAMLRRLIEAGMDVARLSLAHSPLDEALERYRRIRSSPPTSASGSASSSTSRTRRSALRRSPIPARCSPRTPRSASWPAAAGSSAEVVEVDYERVLVDLRVGDMCCHSVTARSWSVSTRSGRTEASGTVTAGGVLQGRRASGCRLDRVSLSTPTDEDLRKLDAFVDVGVDMVAVSFVRSAHDVRRVGTEPHPRGPLVVAKIETRAAVENLTGIIDASAAIMVARGDLGTECDLAELPHLQKRIIAECIAAGLPVITATQMLDSMIHAPHRPGPRPATSPTPCSTAPPP